MRSLPMRRFRRPPALLLSFVVLGVLAACAHDGVTSTPAPTVPVAPRTPPPSPTPEQTAAALPSPPATPTAATPAATRPASTPTTAPTSTPTVASAPGKTAALGQRVTLSVGDEVGIEGTTWLVLFEAVVQDSRCPLDVVCIHAGSVTVAFAASDGHASLRAPVTLEGSAPARAALGELELSLHAVEPQPLASRPTRPGDYRATISLDRPVASPRASGIDGLVTLGPLCPVMREDEPCPDRPFEATLVIKGASGVEVARLRSDAAGRFAIDLPPGRYIIEPQRAGTSPLPMAGPLDVTVVEGRRVAVLIAYDSGIR